MCVHHPAVKGHSSGSGPANPGLCVCVLATPVLATEIETSGFQTLLLSLSLPFSPPLSLLLGYWSSLALWVQRVKAWKAKQTLFQRSHESLKCLLFQPGPGRRVHCASDPRAHLEIQWLNLAHPALNQSIPIISYCLPSATGLDEPERERQRWRPMSGEGAALVWVCVGFTLCRWGAKAWACCGHVLVWKCLVCSNPQSLCLCVRVCFQVVAHMQRMYSTVWERYCTMYIYMHTYTVWEWYCMFDPHLSNTFHHILYYKTFFHQVLCCGLVS